MFFCSIALLFRAQLALIALSSLDFLTSELTKPIMFVIITAQNEGHSVICVNPIHDHDTSAMCHHRQVRNQDGEASQPPIKL